jgi:hypothetical protein
VGGKRGQRQGGRDSNNAKVGDHDELQWARLKCFAATISLYCIAQDDDNLLFE